MICLGLPVPLARRRQVPLRTVFLGEEVMTDGESFILKPKDTALIVKLQDPTELENLLAKPFEVIAEVVSGYLASGSARNAARTNGAPSRQQRYGCFLRTRHC
jgi:hypothetical protein